VVDVKQPRPAPDDPSGVKRKLAKREAMVSPLNHCPLLGSGKKRKTERNEKILVFINIQQGA